MRRFCGRSSWAPLICFDLRSYLNNLRQELRHFSVGSAVVSVRVLCLISQTDFKSLCSGLYNDFVLEPLSIPDLRCPAR
jgi:hypothetical protein